MFSRIGRVRPQPNDQILQWRLDNALMRYQKLEMDYQDIYSHYMYQKDMTIRLNNDMSIVMEWNRNIMSEKGQLEHDHADLLQQYNDLQHKYNKKVESYKELDKNYMDLVRPLLVTSDDPSTIYNGLMKIRVSIENLIQKSKGDRSINLQHKIVVGRFKKYGLLEVFPEETHLDSYHLNLYMESEVMMVLIRRMFTRPLGYLLKQNMSAKIKELCYDTFDLSFAMFGMESMIYPVRISLGIPFDNENMTTPHKSNPAGSVSLADMNNGN
ncbi:hypothetical protein BGZ98_008807 [Dissophora globulifera]|nr:hypothetical protein BGZ98_008807 [Dissophora globulifera]